MPASCMAYDEDLSALVDEELSAEREAELREHVAGCERCAHRLEAFCDVDLALASVPAPEVPGDLRARLAARVAADQAPARPAVRARSAPPAPRRRATGGRVAALLAVAAALVLAVWFAVRGDAPVQPALPVAQTPPGPELELAEVGLPELGDLAEADVAILVELEDLEDLDVIANLDLLERFLALEAAGGAG